MACAFGDPRRRVSDKSEEKNYQGDLIVIDSIEEERMEISEEYMSKVGGIFKVVPPVVDSAFLEQTYQEAS